MKPRQVQRVIVLCAVVLSIGVFAGSADTETGALVGVVHGPGGVVLSGVTVTVTDQSGDAAAAVVSGKGGEFKITGLAPGTYRVDAELQGFHSSTATGLTVDPGRALRIELELALATFHDTMQVDSALPPSSLETAVLRESAARDVGEAMARLPGVWTIRKGGSPTTSSSRDTTRTMSRS